MPYLDHEPAAALIDGDPDGFCQSPAKPTGKSISRRYFNVANEPTTTPMKLLQYRMEFFKAWAEPARNRGLTLDMRVLGCSFMLMRHPTSTHFDSVEMRPNNGAGASGLGKYTKFT
jgi:hypothetical protein